MVCCIVADLITNPILTLNFEGVGCVICVSIRTFDFLGVHLHIFSWCAFCMDGIYPNVVYYS